LATRSGAITGEEQILANGRLVLLGPARLAGEDAEHAVRVTHRGDLGVGHHYGVVGVVHGHMGAMFDPRRGVADDVVEALPQVLQDLADALLGQGVLVPGLGGRQDIEGIAPLVTDQGLIDIRLAIDDVDEVIDHPPLAPHDEVEVAQAHVEVDDHGAVPTLSQAHGQRGAGGRLTHAALAGCNYDSSRQCLALP
jgi:hypothetical protein